MPDIPLTIAVSEITDADLDVEQRIAATQALGTHLADLPGVAVAPVHLSPGTDGTRAVDATAIGTIVATLASTGVLTALVRAIQTWLKYRTLQVTLKLGDDELTLRGGPEESQLRLVERFLDRHAPQNT